MPTLHHLLVSTLSLPLILSKMIWELLLSDSRNTDFLSLRNKDGFTAEELAKQGTNRRCASNNGFAVILCMVIVGALIVSRLLNPSGFAF